MKISNLEAIAYHLEQGEDNGGITREALAVFLRSVAYELKSFKCVECGEELDPGYCVTCANSLADE